MLYKLEVVSDIEAGIVQQWHSNLDTYVIVFIVLVFIVYWWPLGEVDRDCLLPRMIKHECLVHISVDLVYRYVQEPIKHARSVKHPRD